MCVARGRSWAKNVIAINSHLPCRPRAQPRQAYKPPASRQPIKKPSAAPMGKGGRVVDSKKPGVKKAPSGSNIKDHPPRSGSKDSARQRDKVNFKL